MSEYLIVKQLTPEQLNKSIKYFHTDEFMVFHNMLILEHWSY